MTGRFEIASIGDSPNVGTLILSGANNYSGVTTVVAGGSILNATNDKAFGNASGYNDYTRVYYQSTVKLSNNITTEESFKITGHGASVSNTKIGAIHNASGNNTWSGSIKNDGDSSIVVAPSTTLTLSGSVHTNDNMYLDLNGSSQLIATGTLSGTGDWHKSGNGTLRLDWHNDDEWTGSLNLNGGVQRGHSSGTITSTFEISSTKITNNDILIIEQNEDGTYKGNMFGSGSVEKKGTGKVTFSGKNTYTGPTTVRAGTLNLQGGSALDDSSPVYVMGRTSKLILPEIQMIHFHSLTLSDHAEISVIGIEHLIITRFMELTDARVEIFRRFKIGHFPRLDEVQIGDNLILNNASYFSSRGQANDNVIFGNVLINDTSTLAGNYTINGKVTVAENASIRPGNSTGIWTVTGDLILDGTAYFEIAGTGAAGAVDGYDQINVTESVNFGEDWVLNLTNTSDNNSYQPAAGKTFDILTYNTYIGAAPNTIQQTGFYTNFKFNPDTKQLIKTATPNAFALGLTANQASVSAALFEGTDVLATYGGSVGFGYEFALLDSASQDKLSIVPNLYVSVSQFSRDSFTESGVVTSLNIDSLDKTNLSTSLGAQLLYGTMLGDLPFMTEVSLGWLHQYMDPSESFGASFVTGSDAPFTVGTPEVGQDAVTYNVGIGLEVINGGTVYLDYQGQWRTNGFVANGFNAGWRMQF